MRICNKCKVNEATARQYKCKECHNIYQKNYYKNNPNSVSQSGKRRKKEIREIIMAAKNVPCIDCKIKYPYFVMDFDHRPDENKSFNIADAGSKHMSLETLKNEINKCDIVCSNCHRFRTFSRIG